MINIFSGLSFLATILTIASYCFMLKDNKKLTKTIKIVNIFLLIVITILSSFYYETVNAKMRAKDFYERYANTSFKTDFTDSKIRAVVNDGMVIFYDLKLDKKYPVLYETIKNRYKNANEADIFDRDQYVMIARDLFGIFGGISGKLFDGSYVAGGENER